MKTSNETSSNKSTGSTNSTSQASAKAQDLTPSDALRAEVSPKDRMVRGSLRTDQGPKELVDSSKVQLEQQASMTPSEFWSSKLGECYTKGIAPADCKPWS